MALIARRPKVRTRIRAANASLFSLPPQQRAVAQLHRRHMLVCQVHSLPTFFRSYPLFPLVRSAIAPMIWRRRLVIVCTSLLVMLPAAMWTLRSATFDQTSARLLLLLLLLLLLMQAQAATNFALGHHYMNHGAFTSVADAQEVGAFALRPRAPPP